MRPAQRSEQTVRFSEDASDDMLELNPLCLFPSSVTQLRDALESFWSQVVAILGLRHCSSRARAPSPFASEVMSTRQPLRTVSSPLRKRSWAPSDPLFQRKFSFETEDSQIRRDRRQQCIHFQPGKLSNSASR